MQGDAEAGPGLGGERGGSLAEVGQGPAGLVQEVRLTAKLAVALDWQQIKLNSVPPLTDSAQRSWTTDRIGAVSLSLAAI